MLLQHVIGPGLIPRPAGFAHRELQPTAADEFQLLRPRWKFRFTRGPAHSITGFTLDAGRTQGLFFSRSGTRARAAE